MIKTVYYSFIMLNFNQISFNYSSNDYSLIKTNLKSVLLHHQKITVFYKEVTN